MTYYFFLCIDSPLTSTNSPSIMFTSNQNNFVVCSSNFQSQQNETPSPVMGEITADQILDMPIVFADEPPQEEIKVENSSYFIPNTIEHKVVVKEEPVDDDEEYEVLCPTISRTAIPERLKIKQVFLIFQCKYIIGTCGHKIIYFIKYLGCI